MRLTLVATAAPFSVGGQDRVPASVDPSATARRPWVRCFADDSRHGYSPRVAPHLALKKIDHIDQSNESDMAFLTRLALSHNAVTKPINELYVLAGPVSQVAIGQGTAGVKLSVTADNRPGDRAFITAKLDETTRAKYQGCKTSWWDVAAGGSAGGGKRYRAVQDLRPAFIRTKPKPGPSAKVRCADGA